MWQEFQAELWQGRIDSEDTPAPRWHQLVQDFGQAPAAVNGAPVLLGFACDEGVRRNGGRHGAAAGPEALRRALANLSWQPISYLGAELKDGLYDAGTVVCDGPDLEQAQLQYGHLIANILQAGGLPIGLGGGHEIAWGSYSGLEAALRNQDRPVEQLAIINLDAHLDLRKPYNGSTSGTPFRQIAEHRLAQGWPFHYACFGVNPSANTRALFEFAAEHDVFWRADVDCSELDLDSIGLALQDFLQGKDGVYLTICLDVLSAAFAPGVSAPSALGLSPGFVLRFIHLLRQTAEQMNVPLLLVDVAEMNPRFDIDGRTAKLAARLIQGVIE